jgi:hypothetical protein
MHDKRCRFHLVNLALLVALAGTARAGGPPMIYTEDFRTTTFKDPAGTTVNWDTASGTLHLEPFAPAEVGACRETGPAFGVVTFGAYAYVASSERGLVVVDLADPTHPSLIGALEIDGTPRAVAVSGSTLAVAAGAGGVTFFDVRHPAEPALLSTIQIGDDAMDVVMVGRHVYIAALGAGLVVLDIADRAHPILISETATADRAMGVVVEGDHAFVADYRAGITVFNINVPGDPLQVGSLATGGTATALDLNGDLLAVAAGTNGVRLIDVSDPTMPQAAGAVTTAGSALGVTLQHRLLLTTTSPPLMYAHDVTDPAQPAAKWTREIGGVGHEVAVYGNLGLVAADSWGLDVLQIEQPAPDLPYIANYYGVDMHNPRDVAMSGNVAFVATEPEGMLVISVPGIGLSPRLAAIGTPGNAVAVAVSGKLACVADSLAGLRLFDVTDPSAPVARGAYDTPGQALDVAISGNAACVADGTGDLKLINISNPYSPSLMATCALPGTANAVALSGSLACVTDGGLRLVDIANPAAPVLRGSYTNFNGGTAQGVAVFGSTAWVAAGASGLFAIDISEPTTPALLAVVPAASTLVPYRSPVCYGPQLVALEAGGSITDSYLRFLDITNPTDPVEIQRFALNHSDVNAIAVDGDRVITLRGPAPANYIGGLTVCALAQPDVAGPLGGEALSLNVVPGLPYVVCARFAAVETGSVDWKVYTFTTGMSIPSVTTWFNVNREGFGLRWRAELGWDQSNPTVSQVQLEWRLREARIDSIVDVRGDQGGWANLHLTGSGLDMFSGQITGYNVYRRVDDKALEASVRTAKSALAGALDAETRLTGAEVEFDGQTYVVNEPGTKDVPAGVWSIVSSFWPTRQDRYIVTVPTVRDDGPDAPGWSSYYVSAWKSSTSEFFASYPDSGRSVDNIAPGVPAGLSAAYSPGGVALQWAPAGERDFQYYRLYRGDSPDFTPGPQSLIGATATATWNDQATDPWRYSYKVTCVDHAGNESGPATPQQTSGVDALPAPSAFALRGNEPNPFNAGTTVRYEVPDGGGQVTLAVFDTRGCRVRTLVDGVMPAGRHGVKWDGRDDQGRGVATGTYFCRLLAPGFTRTHKMSLLQ